MRVTPGRRRTLADRFRGTNKEGCGGLGEQIPYQGLDPGSILIKAKQLMK
jgi:hypothetical protein